MTEEQETSVTDNEATIAFKSELESPVSLYVGKDKEWSLPQFTGSYSPSNEIKVTPSSAMARYISYDPKNNTITFADDGTSEKFVNKPF